MDVCKLLLDTLEELKRCSSMPETMQTAQLIFVALPLLRYVIHSYHLPAGPPENGSSQRHFPY